MTERESSDDQFSYPLPSISGEKPYNAQRKKGMTNMSRVFVIVATATLCSTITSVRAQEQGGFYVGADLGYVFAGNTRSDGVFTGTGSMFDGQRLGPAPEQTAKGTFDSGLTASLTVGYDLGMRRFGRLRFEGEFLRQNADTDRYNGELDGTDLTPPGRVDTTMTGVVLNILYSIGQFGAVRPYIYGGIGQGRIETKYDFPGRGQVEIDGSPSTGILQAGLGVDIPLKERMTLDLKYRFRRAGLNEGGQDTDIDTNIFQVGIRYAF